MRTVLWLCILILALAAVWPSAVGALNGVFDLSLAARSLVVGFLLGLLLNWLGLYVVVHNRIVERDRDRDLTKVNDQHNKRRI